MSAEILKTESIRRHKSSTDGLRISVMSRHTLNDGVTPDLQILPTSFDIWMKELAPPQTLIGDYYKRGLSWEEFEDRYKKFLREGTTQLFIGALLKLLQTQTITLLCVEDTPEQCHRRLLAEECKLLRPSILLSIA